MVAVSNRSQVLPNYVLDTENGSFNEPSSHAGSRRCQQRRIDTSPWGSTDRKWQIVALQRDAMSWTPDDFGGLLGFDLSRLTLRSSIHPRDVNILGKFASLKQQWLRETAMLSSVTTIAMNQAYQRIIGMGPAVVPLILLDLSKEPNHWFWALSAITGENPIAPEDAGDLDRMAAVWLRLGQERGWI